MFLYQRGFLDKFETNVIPTRMKSPSLLDTIEKAQCNCHKLKPKRRRHISHRLRRQNDKINIRSRARIYLFNQWQTLVLPIKKKKDDLISKRNQQRTMQLISPDIWLCTLIKPKSTETPNHTPRSSLLSGGEIIQINPQRLGGIIYTRDKLPAIILSKDRHWE